MPVIFSRGSPSFSYDRAALSNVSLVIPTTPRRPSTCYWMPKQPLSSCLASSHAFKKSSHPFSRLTALMLVSAYGTYRVCSTWIYSIQIFWGQLVRSARKLWPASYPALSLPNLLGCNKCPVFLRLAWRILPRFLAGRVADPMPAQFAQMTPYLQL